MIKRIQKRISRGISLAGEIFSGPSPMKLLRNAIESDEEEKALEVYMTAALPNGIVLADDLDPSAAFPSKKGNNHYNQTTPLHLACYNGLYRLVVLFLNHGGNPNLTNGRDETCLHCICNKSNKLWVRYEILQLLINWKGNEIDGKYEGLSINHVDVDGNSALHYAASNGLLQCVESLIQLNGILSIVNKSQMTCCEMADENNNRDLASMLELAMLFQPMDLIIDDESNGNSIDRPSILYLDTISMDLNDLLVYVNELITNTLDKLISSLSQMSTNQLTILTKERVEVLLNAYGWDANRLQSEYIKSPQAVYEFAKISPSTDSMKSDMMCGICCDEMIPMESIDKIYEDARNHIDISKYTVCCDSRHQFCLSCWSLHTQTQVRDNGGYCLSCPAFKCHEIVAGGNRMVDALLSSSIDKLKYKYHEQRVRHVVDCQPLSMKWCPVPDCGAIVRTTSYVNENDSSDLARDMTNLPPKSMICHNNHSFCLSCGLEAHSPCACKDWKIWVDKVKEEITAVNDGLTGSGKGDDIANALWMAANTKKCPRCTSPIEKDEGCNHMSCRKCRHEFCWICMQDWSLHSNNTGGFFQCNRYVSELLQQTGVSDESANRSGNNDNFVSLVEELGNAHVETQRIKERAAKMARFIPLYTRFKAQRDSVLMERRMFKDTMNRIQSELTSTYQAIVNNDKNSSKKWLQGDRVNHPFMDYPVDKSNDKNIAILPSNKTNYHPSIQFLEDGFVELIKCREFLSGCVAYSYSIFTSDEDGADIIMRALSRNRMHKYRSVLKLSDHKASFERIQADLEMYTEMLSDVVARRRLRASHSQIIDITKLARMKRIELEDLVYMFHFSEAIEKSEGYNNSYAYNDPIPTASTSSMRHRTRQSRRSNNNNTSNSVDMQNNFMNSLSIGPDGMIFMNDDLALTDDLDFNSLVQLISRIESTHLSGDNDNRSTDRIVRDNNNIQINSAVETIRPEIVPSRTSRSPFAQFLRSNRSNSTAVSNEINLIESNVNEMHRSASASSTSPNSKVNDSLIDLDDISIVDSLTSRNITTSNVNSIDNTIDLSQENNAIDRLGRPNRRNQRLDEERELNRAILLSLQELPSNQLSSNSLTVVSQDNIDILVSMGFTVDQAIETLQICENKLDVAINRLLGLT